MKPIRRSLRTVILLALSYTFLDDEDGSSIEITVNDPSYSSISIIATDENGIVSNGFFNRDADGTERFEETSSDGNVFGFIERPDCSGTLTQVSFDDGVQESSLDAAFSSALLEPLVISGERCEFDDGVETCLALPL